MWTTLQVISITIFLTLAYPLLALPFSFMIMYQPEATTCSNCSNSFKIIKIQLTRIVILQRKWSLMHMIIHRFSHRSNIKKLQCLRTYFVFVSAYYISPPFIWWLSTQFEDLTRQLTKIIFTQVHSVCIEIIFQDRVWYVARVVVCIDI